VFDKLVNAKSVAVVGASENPMKIGYAIMKNLVEGQYNGEIYPVNKSAKTILNLQSYSSLSDIGKAVDLCVIAVPASLSVDVVREAIKCNIPFIVLIPGGFSEIGEEGKQLEEKIMSIIKNSGTRVIGPNTVGIYFPHSNLNTALTPPDRVSFPKPGSISFISQSGALGLLTMDSISELGIGISAFINLGNRIDVDEIELIKYFKNDPKTKSIAIYLESVHNGREFYETLKEVNRVKPIVVLKSGRTASSARAASLHTGAMGTDDRIFQGMLRQAGVARAYNEVELIDYARVLSYSPLPDGKNVAIVTTAGGVGVITSDYISATEHGMGLNMASLSSDTKDKIKGSIISFGSAENPVDLTADGSIEAYDSVLSALQEDDNVNIIVSYALPQTPKMNMGIVDVISKYSHAKKPVIVGVIGSKLGTDLIREFEKRQIPAFPSIERVVNSVRALYDYSLFRKGGVSE
jgi:acyl-CoA synthetase (NDP forming)